MAVNDKDMAIGRVMLDHLNAWPDRPADFDLETIAKEAPAAMLMHLPTSGVIRKYVDGSFLGEWCFSVYLRVNKADTSEKLEVFDQYEELWQYLISAGMPVLPAGMKPRNFERIATPSCAASFDNGTEDYQANFRLVFSAPNQLQTQGG